MAHLQPLPASALTEHEERFALVEQVMGFVPNSMKTMARVPGLVESFGALAGAVFMNGLIPPDLVQMVAMMVSTGAGCRYCQAHTSHSAARLGVSEDKLAEMWSFETSELFTEAERAALRLAFHAGQVPNAATAEHFAAAKEHYSDDQVAAVVAVCSLFGYLNRWNDTMATELEEHPAGFGERVLGAQGWEVGKHAAHPTDA
jgi:AhpD family alkylhydroperoxidase